MPFGPYSDFSDCVSKNPGKDNPQAFCAYVEHEITGRWPAEKQLTSYQKKMYDNNILKSEMFELLSLSSEYIIAKEIEDGSKERIFEGWGSTEIVDLQGDLIPAEALKGVMPTVMKRGAPLIDSHSNRVVGKILDYDFRPNDGVEGLWLKGLIFSDYSVDDQVWDDLKNNRYTGLSLGGKAKDIEIAREKNGKEYRIINDPEIWEWSIVRGPAKPANQGALIENINFMAKMDKEPGEVFRRKGLFEIIETCEPCQKFLKEEMAKGVKRKDAVERLFIKILSENHTNKTTGGTTVLDEGSIKKLLEKYLEEQKMPTTTKKENKDVKKDTTDDPSAVAEEKPTDSAYTPDTGTEKQEGAPAENAAAEQVTDVVEDKLMEVVQEIKATVENLDKRYKGLAEKVGYEYEEEKPTMTPEEEMAMGKKVDKMAETAIAKHLKGLNLTKAETPRPSAGKKKEDGTIQKDFKESAADGNMVKDMSWRELGHKLQEIKSPGERLLS